MASIPDSFINYTCDLVQSLTSIFSVLKLGYTKSLESPSTIQQNYGSKDEYTKCQVAK